VKKPFISGFTIVRNAVRFDYPVKESIKSILPVVDEMIVAVGNSDDETMDLIKNIKSDKIKIVESVWDDSLREGGKVLAVETNKAFDYISDKADWCFYIQADEVLHEKYYPEILHACSHWLEEKSIEGLLFKYLHFYGSYDYIGDSRQWYRNEIRIIRNNKQIRSYRDAQGFRINDRKLIVKPINAFIYHYGWVKDPRHQQEKQKHFHKMWHDDNWVKENVAEADAYDYSVIDSLVKFTGTHPEVMRKRLQRMNWNFHFDASKRKVSLKNKLIALVEKLTGYRLFEYKNYKKI